MKPKTDKCVTSVIRAELEIGGEYDREVEVVITTDNKVTQRQALEILGVLHPNVWFHHFKNIEISEV